MQGRVHNVPPRFPVLTAWLFEHVLSSLTTLLERRAVAVRLLSKSELIFGGSLRSLRYLAIVHSSISSVFDCYGYDADKTQTFVINP